ncbi:MAG: ribose 5-phosphate isomerase B [Deferribacterales bacterium]|nr:ribose 5-phosphate isomerase B [Deferribacterales bacterium]
MFGKKIAIGSDHAGFSLKQTIIDYLTDKGIQVDDCGTYSEESTDYPDYAAKVAKTVVSDDSYAGILICGTGIGISIAANRFKGVRAALCHDSFTAAMSRKHNNANILAMGAKVVSWEIAKEIIDIWLSEEYEGGRHERRLEKIEENLIQY